MKKINTNKVFHAESIYFNSGEAALHDKMILFVDNFLIVGNDVNDTAPTMYNVNEIKKIEGAEDLFYYLQRKDDSLETSEKRHQAIKLS